MSTTQDPWEILRRPFTDATPAYVEFFDALRAVLDSSSVGAPDDATLLAAARGLRDVDRLLAAHEVPEGFQLAGRQANLSGRGSPLFPSYVIEHRTDDRIAGQVRFRNFFRGANNAAQGGTLALLFDDILGQLAHPPGSAVSRTASITVNYRAVTPMETDLRFDTWVDRVEGRKQWLAGRLLDGDRVLADAEGLFVALRPGGA